MKACVGPTVLQNLVVVEEEEHLLLQDRAADSAAKVVVAKNRNCRLRTGAVVVPTGIEEVILSVLVSVSVELAGPALGDLVDDQAANTVFRRERGLGDLHLAYRIHLSNSAHIVAMAGDHRNAIVEDVGVGKVPVRGSHHPRIRRRRGVRGRARSAREQDHELCEVLVDQGHGLTARFGLQQGHVG